MMLSGIYVGKMVGLANDVDAGALFFGMNIHVRIFRE